MCKDGSCKDNSFDFGACYDATIDYVVGPSCKSGGSNYYPCRYASLSGVTLINSCNGGYSCYNIDGDEQFSELNDCCNANRQCQGKEGLAIVTAGGPNCVSLYVQCVL